MENGITYVGIDAHKKDLRGGPHPSDRYSSQLKVESGFMIQAAFGWPEVGRSPRFGQLRR